MFAGQLAEVGAVIVSGMALGIDAIAQRSVLAINKKTISFLGCGVDIVYPPQNKMLYEQIISSGGLVISEFPPGHVVRPGMFVARNRLISGLSRGVLVIEGLKDSGSLITARYAAEQGKEVFAPPVPITSPLSEAPTILLKQGAKLALSIDDILEEFNLKVQIQKQKLSFDTLTKEEQNVCELLLQEELDADELRAQSNISIAELLPLLTDLEIKGVVEKNEEGKYHISLTL